MFGRLGSRAGSIAAHRLGVIGLLVCLLHSGGCVLRAVLLLLLVMLLVGLRRGALVLVLLLLLVAGLGSTGGSCLVPVGGLAGGWQAGHLAAVRPQA